MLTKPGVDQASGAVDVPGIGQVTRRRARADGGDPVALDDDVADGVLRPPGVHRDDRAPVEHDRGHGASPAPTGRSRAAPAIRPAASRTASRIFS